MRQVHAKDSTSRRAVEIPGPEAREAAGRTGGLMTRQACSQPLKEAIPLDHQDKRETNQIINE